MRYLLKKIYSWRMLILSSLSLLFICFSFYKYATTDDPKNNDIIITDIKVVKTIDVPIDEFAPVNILNHNDIIISTLNNRQATAFNVLSARESDIKQARTIYIAILVVLISLLFNKKRKESELLKYIFLLLTILVMYLVEVHSKDLLQRQENCANIIAKSTESVVNSKEIYSKWYELDYDKYLNQIRVASKGSFIRKLISAVHPEIGQFGIYIFPFVLLSGIFFWISVKKVE